MENIKLSANVKQYFINALKGIGIGDISKASGKFVEMSEYEIGELLNNRKTTTDLIYQYIKEAVLQQLRNDQQSEQYTKKTNAFDRATVQKILENKTFETQHGNVQFNPQICETCINNLTDSTIQPNNFQLDQTTEIVISTLFAGMNEQKLSKNEKGEAAVIWNEIHMTGYKKWFETKTGSRPNLPYSEQTPSFSDYYKEKLKEDLLKETTARCDGDQVRALEILQSKVDDDMLNYLKANDQLLNQSYAFCQECGKNPQEDLTMADVLAVMSTESAATQVTAYFQTRSREQQTIVKAKPNTIEVNRQNKIGNLIGNVGKKVVKLKTHKDVLVAADAKGSLRQGKSGPWRGYKSLYDRILAFLRELYNSVLSAGTVGFVQGIMEKRGTWINTEVRLDNNYTHEPKNLTQSWQTDAQTIPDEYFVDAQTAKTTLNVAGEFYNKTKARLLADKMRLISLSAKMEDASKQTQDLTNLREEAQYFEQRINTAEGLLQNAIPESQSESFHDQKYFDLLEKRILAEENVKNDNVKQFLKVTKNYSANDEMIAALKQFKQQTANAKVGQPSQIKAKRAMAVEMFQLYSSVNNGTLTGGDLDAMTERFMQSRIEQMCDDLHQYSAQGREKFNANQNSQLNSQDYVITAVDVNAQIKDFVENDLIHNAAKTQYEQHLVNQNRSKILDAMSTEKTM